MELTVVLTNYLRPGNIPQILESLAGQTLRHRLFVWDNSPEQTFVSPQADWIIRSSCNTKCVARWWMAAQADTPFILVMDDDLAPSDSKVLSDTLEKLIEHNPSAVGATGVNLDPTKPYHKCKHIGLGTRRIRSDTTVEILKGRFFAMNTDLTRVLPYMPFDTEDDIVVSGAIKGGVVLSCLQDRFQELSTGKESRFRRPEHRQAREAARRRMHSTPDRGP